MYWTLGYLLAGALFLLLTVTPLFRRVRYYIYKTEAQDDFRTVELLHIYDDPSKRLTFGDKLEFILRYTGYVLVAIIIYWITVLFWPVIIIGLLILTVAVLREYEENKEN